VATSTPSEIPAVETAARESTVHSCCTAEARVLERELRTGVSSGAKIVRMSLRSSLLELAEPGFEVYVFE
jgi:hypothetical protein